MEGKGRAGSCHQTRRKNSQTTSNTAYDGVGHGCRRANETILVSSPDPSQGFTDSVVFLLG